MNKRQSAQFDKLTSSAKRIAIAVDVLAQLAKPAHQRFKVIQDIYCHFDTPTNLFADASTELQALLPKAENHCKVCAMGALFLSHVRFADKFTVGDGYSGCNFLYISSEHIADNLDGVFDADVLRVIEVAFKGKVSDAYAFNSDNKMDYNQLGHIWKSRIPDPTHRLRAICKNIIEHNGDFNITDLPKGPDSPTHNPSPTH